MHIDRNQQNNRSDNLQWATRTEVNKKRGLPTSKQILEIRDDFNAKFPQGWKNPLQEWVRETSKKHKLTMETCRKIAVSEIK